MAKQKEETRTGVEEINDSLTRIGTKVQENSKMVTWIVVGIAALVAVAFIGYYGFYRPGVESSDNAIAQADLQMIMQNDSTALGLYQEVADNYGHAAGNRAKLNAAILLYKEKKYEDAIKYLDDFNAKDGIIGASAYSLEGDCYVNLKNYDEALKYFEKAEKASGDNPALTPAFMLKQATVYREQKNFEKEADVYQKMLDNYPDYGPGINMDVEAYLQRAKLDAQGGNK